MDESDNIPRITFRRDFKNLPKRQEGKKQEKKERGSTEEEPEAPRRAPDDPERGEAPSVDLTA